MKSFKYKENEYEMFYGKDKHIEVYEVKNPGKTGFVFDDIKEAIFFVNKFTDFIESTKAEEKKKNEQSV